MSLNRILGTAIGALQVNQTALKVTSQNIANVNTEGYHRRVVSQAPQVTDGRLSGVTIDEIRRISDQYLARESIVSAGATKSADVTAQFFERVQSAIGALDGGSSLQKRISDVNTALTQLAVEPASRARRSAALISIEGALGAISSMGSQVQGFRQDANTELSAQITRANALLTEVYDLNTGVKSALLRGDTASGLLDQRDRAVAELSGLMDIQAFEQPDGRLFLSMGDGMQLVSDIYSRLEYEGPLQVNAATSFPAITLQRINPSTEQPIGPSVGFEGRLRSGSMRGLLDMRDGALPDLAEQLGTLAGGLVEGLNAIHGNASAVPAPQTLTGTASGLLATDALNFTGRTSLAVTNAAGELVRRVDIDFDAGTLSSSGGGALAIGTTVGSLISAVNTALGGDGTAVFGADGVLSVSATASGNGVSFVQDAANGSARGGRSLAQVFGLNDLVVSTVRPTGNTGLTASDAHGFTAGGQMGFTLRSPTGAVLIQGTYTVGGSSTADLVSGLNTAMGGFASFSLDANGALVMSSTQNARLEINADTTARGTAGLSISTFFGLGSANAANRAMGLTIRDDIAANSSKFALAQADLTASATVGTMVLGPSDNRAAQAMAALAQAPRGWPAGGGLGAQTGSIMEYATQIVALQAQNARAAADDQAFRAGVAAEVQQRKTGVEGVNLDEELAQMIVYQQAYNAAARIMTTVQDMYDTLVSVVR